MGECFPGIAMNPSMDAARSPSLAIELPGKHSPIPGFERLGYAAMGSLGFIVLIEERSE